METETTAVKIACERQEPYERILTQHSLQVPVCTQVVRTSVLEQVTCPLLPIFNSCVLIGRQPQMEEEEACDDDGKHASQHVGDYDEHG